MFSGRESSSALEDYIEDIEYIDKDIYIVSNFKIAHTNTKFIIVIIYPRTNFG